MNHILICEDEQYIREFIVVNLEQSGFKVIATDSGEQAIKCFKKYIEKIDVAILDVMLPGISGFDVLKQIRKTNSNIGIIMLTAKTQEIDKIKGLNLGADDYISKPFSPSELIARINAIFRRIEKFKQTKKIAQIFKTGPFVLDSKTQTLTKNGNTIELTQTENQLINLFFTNPKTAINKSTMLQTIWGTSQFNEIKIVDVNIRRLRVKIENDPSNPVFLQTVWGYGYKWTLDVQF